MKKLNALGIGPKIGMVTIPYLIITIFLTLWLKPTFAFSVNMEKALIIAGIVLFVIGLAFYITTVVLLLKGIKNQRMITTGTYYLCQNPLYASMIIMLVPAIGLMLNSWLVLSTSLIAWWRFRIFIQNEYDEMEDIFGSAYLEYKRSTPELFPFPFRKFFS
jgi:protein-S-isoprenylcysteine O-methyltransferase Ste14